MLKNKNNTGFLRRPFILLLIYTGIIGLSFLVGHFSGVSFLSLFSNNPGLLFTAGVFFVLALFAPYIYLYYQQKIDTRRISVQSEQLNHLRMLAQGALEIDDLDRLLDIIPRFLMHMYISKMNVKLSHASVYFYDNVTKTFILVSHRGKIRPAKDYLNSDSPLIIWYTQKVPELVKKRYFTNAELETLSYEDIDYLLRRKDLLVKEPGLEDFLKQLQDELFQLNVSLCIPSFYQNECNGFLILGKKSKGRYSQEEIDALSTVSYHISMAIRSAKLRQDLAGSYFEAIHGLSKSLEARDPYTKGHSERVVWYSLAIAAELINIPPYNRITNFLAKVQEAALLHDVGKIGIRDNILLKPAPLTAEEMEIVMQHPNISEHILRSLRGVPEDVLLGIKYHHERCDGTGYAHLRTEQIPPIARLLAVADTYDAMTTDRPYRKGLSDREALKEIIKNTYYSGPQWDSVVVEAFLRAFQHGRVKEGVVFSKEDILEIKKEIEASGLAQKVFSGGVE